MDHKVEGKWVAYLLCFEFVHYILSFALPLLVLWGSETAGVPYLQGSVNRQSVPDPLLVRHQLTLRPWKSPG